MGRKPGWWQNELDRSIGKTSTIGGAVIRPAKRDKRPNPCRDTAERGQGSGRQARQVEREPSWWQNGLDRNIGKASTIGGALIQPAKQGERPNPCRGTVERGRGSGRLVRQEQRWGSGRLVRPERGWGSGRRVRQVEREPSWWQNGLDRSIGKTSTIGGTLIQPARQGEHPNPCRGTAERGVTGQRARTGQRMRQSDSSEKHRISGISGSKGG